MKLVETEKQILSVSEVTCRVKSLLETQLASVWVQGEVSNFKTAASGHSYFTLKDENAQLQAVLFRFAANRVPFRVENGQHLICHGRLNVYEKGGSYSLVVDAMEVKGKGALQIAFEQLKAKLHKEGLFDEAHKKAIPAFPEHIGIVTSPTGAAIRDILNIVGRRFKNVHIILNPVRVQGEGSAKEIARAIEEMNEHGQCDVLIVGRGGGSLEDLWAFNEEVVARAIYNSRIPIISAVGHEIDYTIADWVADLRAPTPSAAAELVVAEQEQVRTTIQQWIHHMKRAMANRVKDCRQKLSDSSESYVFQKVRDLIEQQNLRCDELAQRMRQSFEHFTELRQEQIQSLAGRLEALSPLAVLSRGYSLSFKNETMLKNAKELKKGDRVVTRLHKGSFESIVSDVTEENPHG